MTPITHSPYSAPLPSFLNFRLWIERTHSFGSFLLGARLSVLPLARICRIPLEVVQPGTFLQLSPCLHLSLDHPFPALATWPLRLSHPTTSLTEQKPIPSRPSHHGFRRQKRERASRQGSR